MGQTTQGSSLDTRARQNPRAVFIFLVFVVLIAVTQIWDIIFHERILLESDYTALRLDNCPDSPFSLSQSSRTFVPIPALSKNHSFGACLMVKGDNDLLLEWVSYHYTILPLRYLFVASDVGNLEDPSDVLKRWTHAKTDLRWWVVNTSVFENIHGEFHDRGEMTSKNSSNPSLIQEIAHNKLQHRQKAFISYCANFMKREEVQWVTFHDSDEFLFVHRVGLDEDSTEEGSHVISGFNNTEESKSQRLDEKFGLRRYLPSMESNATVVDMIYGLQQIHLPLKSCLTMPRITAGALETTKCPEAEAAIAFARINFQFDLFSTLRFQQHAAKNDFKKNRFGKVFLNIQNISEKSLSSKPLNIHRPFSEECNRPIANVWKSPFYLMHYVGSWERYSSRGDDRRSFNEWEKRAYVNDSTACCAEEVHRWLPRFIDQVGLDRAKFLLDGRRTALDCSTTRLQ